MIPDSNIVARPAQSSNSQVIHSPEPPTMQPVTPNDGNCAPSTPFKSKRMPRKYTNAIRRIMAANDSASNDDVLQSLRHEMCATGDPEDWPTPEKLRTRIKHIRKQIDKSNQPRPGPWATGYIWFTKHADDLAK